MFFFRLAVDKVLPIDKLFLSAGQSAQHKPTTTMTIKEYVLKVLAANPDLALIAENYQSVTADIILFAEVAEEEEEKEFVHEDLTMNSLWAGLEDLELS